MKPEHTLPDDIERTSYRIIERELEARGAAVPASQKPVLLRVIHTTADFDYADSLFFTESAVERGRAALTAGKRIITDTNMALSGVSRRAMDCLHTGAVCYMADPLVAREAKRQQTTRAAVSMQRAVLEYPDAVFAIGNAPTALFELCSLMEQGARPSLVIGVPVGFVNVEESKEAMRSCCEKYRIPAILAMGRKGGSTVAAAICNALLYLAAGLADPSVRL